jgi:hypothetical protein
LPQGANNPRQNPPESKNFKEQSSKLGSEQRHPPRGRLLIYPVQKIIARGFERIFENLFRKIFALPTGS